MQPQAETVYSEVTAHALRRVQGRTVLLALGLVLGFCLWGRGVQAQAQKAENVPAPASEVTADYTIGVDDVLQISAVGQDEVTQTVTVLPDGTIHVNGINEDIKAEGMSVAQLKDRLYKGLSRLYNNLELSVAVKETHSRSVTIVGARTSGQFPLHKDMRVSTLIAAAGGLPGKPKLVVGTLIRLGKEHQASRIKLDILKVAGADPDPSADLLLQNGDTILLDLKDEPPPPTYSVLGAVTKPGSFPMPLDGSPITINRAIADAGEQTSKAALKSAFLLRKGQKIPINLYPLVIEGKTDGPEAKMTLEDGDELHIPEVEAKYMVMGQVNRADAFPLPETQKVGVMQALAEAGGVNAAGDLSRAGIARKVGGKSVYIPVNLQEMIARPQTAKDVTMQDGDVLYVPGRHHSMSIGDVLSPLWIMNALGFSFR
jgi:polysaccharide export outer membrane protein